MSKESKGNKKVLITTAILILTVIGAAVAFFIVSNTEDNNEDVTVTQGLYNKAMELMKTAELPTYFDEDAIQNIYLSNTIEENPSENEGEASGEGNSKEEATDKLLLDFIFYDQKTEQTLSYTLLNDSSEYDYFVENGGELVVLENDKEVYKFQGGYFIKLNEELYASVFSHDETPDDELLKKVITSIGKSEMDLYNLMEFNQKTKVMEPTYTTADDEQNAYAVAIEYTKDEEASISILSLYYDDFVVYQSHNLDYTSVDYVGENPEELFEKDVHEGQPVFIDKTYEKIHYKHNDLSILLLPSGESVNKEEMIKVLKSISFNK